MVLKQIHAELKALSKDNPAGYIRRDLFAYLTLESLKRAAQALVGKEIPAGTGVLSASPQALKWHSTPDVELVPQKVDPVTGLPMGTGNGVDIKITSDFELIVDVFVSGKTSQRISAVTLSFADVRIRLRAAKNEILSEEATFDFVPRIVRTTDADRILAAEKIDRDEASRVEGLGSV